MAKIAFTDPTIRNLPLPEKGQKAFWDSGLAGFGIRVSQGGAKTWVVLDPRSKIRTQETIGRYPVISLADARTEAKRRLAENTLGRHKPRSVRWSTAAESYLKEAERRCKPSTYGEYKRLLGYLKFGDTKLSEVSPHDIQKRLDRLSDAPSEQQHAFVALRAFINWAYGKHHLTENPMARMKPPHPSPARERVLSDDELKSIWSACGTDTFGTIVKLLILTGQRRGEIANLSAAMVKDDCITLPAWLTKNSREHTFPKPLLADAVLASHVAGAFTPKKTEPLLGVPVGDTFTPFSAWSKNKRLLDRASGVSDWTLHDLRRTFASGLASQGVALPVIERLLNHMSGSFSGIVGVYQRYDFFHEMKDAMEKWEARVGSL